MSDVASTQLPKYAYTQNLFAAYIHAIVLGSSSDNATLMLRHPDHGDLIEQPVSRHYVSEHKPRLGGYYTFDPDALAEGFMSGWEFEKKFKREEPEEDTVLPVLIDE